MLLDQLMGVLAAALDCSDALRQIARLLVPQMADLAAIDIMADDGTPQRVAVAYAANPAIATLLQETACDLRDGTFATTLTVLRSGTPYLQETCNPETFELFLTSAELTASQRELLRNLQPRSYLAVPLVYRGRCLGVISLLYTAVSGRRYDGGDQRWALHLAGRIAATLEIARLERVAESAQTQLAQLTHEVERGQALERVIVETTTGPFVVLDALGRPQRTNLVAEKLLGYSGAELMGRAFWQLVPEGEIAAVRAALDAIYADGCARDEAFHWLSRSGSRRRIRWSFSPLLGPNGSVAYVVGVGDLTDEVAQQTAAGALADYLTGLHTLMLALEGAATLDQIAKTVLDRARATLGAGAGVVLRRSPDGLSLETVCAVGYPSGTLQPHVSLSVASPLVTAVRAGEPVLLQSAEELLRAGYAQHAHHLQLGHGAWAAVPLAAQGQVIGALELSFPGPRSFGEDDRAILQLLAAQCSRAIERLELRARLEYRERQLGVSPPPVHDGPGTALSAREQEVLELLVEGLSNREIADRLGVGVVTVKTHVAHVREKLEVTGNTRSRILAARALRLGVVLTSSQGGWSGGEGHPLEDAAWPSRHGTPAQNPPEGGWSAVPLELTMGSPASG